MVTAEMDDFSCYVQITDGERSVSLSEEYFSSNLSAVRDFLALVFAQQ